MLIGLVISVVVVAVIIGALVKIGYIYIGIKDPAERTAVAYHVCDTEIINQYTNLGPVTPDQERTKLNELTSRIKGLAHNEQDPTCQTILFFTAFRTEDYQSMSRPMELVKQMHDNGIYADSNLQVSYSVRAMESLLKEVVSDSPKN